MNDNKIIQLIKENDEQAIANLMAKYSRLLWKVASGILDQIGSDADSEEIVADVFIHIWGNPESFDGCRGSLKSYLCLLCKSKAIDRFRALSRNMATDIDTLTIANSLDLEESLIKAEALNYIYAAIQELSLDEQNVVIRRLFYDQKPADIANATGLKIRQVENIVYRSKIKIRDFIAKEGY